jgi:hypothetical protein
MAFLVYKPKNKRTKKKPSNKHTPINTKRHMLAVNTMMHLQFSFVHIQAMLENYRLPSN